MSITLITRKGQIGSITLDAELSESHSISSTVTGYPVETGAKISDHIETGPRKVSIKGFVTNSPTSGGNADRSYHEVLDDLYKLWEDRELLDVVTHLKIYQNMAITSLEVPRSATTTQSMEFSISLQEVVIASSRTTSVDEVAPEVSDQASTSVDMGSRNTTEPMEKEGTVTSSYLNDFLVS